MSPEERFADNVRHIEAALARRKNNGMELYVLCREMISHPEIRRAAPLSCQLIDEACGRWQRDNYEQQLAAVREEMSQ